MTSPPPDGYSPPESCTICPPGGVYLEGGAACVDPAIDYRQTYTLYKHGQFWFGSFMAFFVTATLVAQAVAWRNFQGKSPFTEMKLSVAQGMVTKPIMKFIMIERSFEAPSTGLVGAYGMTLSDNLSFGDAASAIAGLMMSAINMGKFSEEFHFRLDYSDNDCYQGGHAVSKARFPFFVRIMRMVFILTALGLLSSFAITSHVLHPSLAFLVCFITTGAGSLLSGNGWDSFIAGVMPVAWFQPASNSVFGLNVTHHQKARYLYIMFIMRTLIVIALCSLSLPDGLIKAGTLGRPMGRKVFMSEFIKPVRVILSLSMDGADHMSLGTVCFRAFALLGFVVGATVEILFNLFALLFLPNYCNGVGDEELRSAAKEKQKEIDEWVRTRQLTYVPLES